MHKVKDEQAPDYLELVKHIELAVDNSSSQTPFSLQNKVDEYVNEIKQKRLKLREKRKPSK
jgi:hypothetical protein